MLLHWELCGSVRFSSTRQLVRLQRQRVGEHSFTHMTRIHSVRVHHVPLPTVNASVTAFAETALHPLGLQMHCRDVPLQFGHGGKLAFVPGNGITDGTEEIQEMRLLYLVRE